MREQLSELTDRIPPKVGVVLMALLTIILGLLTTVWLVPT